MRDLLRKLMPAAVYDWLHHHLGWQWFRGPYRNWAEARAASAGYDDMAVLARVVAATRTARASPSAWERDGMIFESPEQNEPLLRALTEAAADSGGGFEVVDFGGALGSVWWQHRVRLSALGLGRWIVVEQPHYVEAGREFAGDILRFEPTLAAATGRSVPSILLFSGVLQYLENPVEMIGRAARLGFAHVIIDRVSLVVAGGTRLMVQHTPSGLGGGNYPCWLFKREDLFAPLLRQYRLHAEWSALDKLARDVSHMGFHFCRRS